MLAVGVEPLSALSARRKHRVLQFFCCCFPNWRFWGCAFFSSITVGAALFVPSAGARYGLRCVMFSCVRVTEVGADASEPAAEAAACSGKT